MITNLMNIVKNRLFGFLAPNSDVRFELEFDLQCS
jgi:hypothetical protein